MPRAERVVAMITLALLNVFLVTAALAVVKLTPDRSLAVRPPTVAARQVITTLPPALSRISASAPMPSAGSLSAKLAGPLRSSGLGSGLTGIVMDATTRRVLFDSRADEPAVPASTTKLTTAVAVLAAVGPDQHITTSAVKSGGGVVLVGGGDPTLTMTAAKNAYPKPAALADLAKQAAATLKSEGTRQVRVDYDASAYQGLRTGPSWKPNYFSEGDVSPVSALELDGGRVAPGLSQRVGDPPRIAAAAFARQLTSRGVNAHVGVRTTAPKGAESLGSVQSPPVSALVEKMLTDSDDDLGEALARQVAMARHQPPTFAGGAAAVHQVLSGLGVGDGVDTVDGSGLSPRNRITPAALARLLALSAAPAHTELRAVQSGMPIAGFTGTLDSRYSLGTAAAGKGLVRAKTGTLNGVNTLAGIAYDADGRLLVFAFMANKVQSPAAAVAALDVLAGTLTTCGCR